MPSYTIHVKNMSGSSQEYMLFSSVPEVASALIPTVFTNIYMTAPAVPTNHGVANFEINTKLYAICGTNPTPLAVDVTVNTSDSALITLGNTTAHTMGTTIPIVVIADAPAFPVGVSVNTIPTGYQIVTGNDFNYPNKNHIFIGLGGDQAGDVVPLATFEAKPSETYTITPVTKYYIGTGSYTPGKIINVQSIGAICEVDFTGNNPLNVVVTHGANGQYTIA